jgi:hypothetical protein
VDFRLQLIYETQNKGVSPPGKTAQKVGHLVGGFLPRGETP